MTVLDFKLSAKRLNKTIRESGIDAYKEGYQQAVDNQANGPYMRTVVERMQRELFINYSSLLNHFEPKRF